MKDNYVAKHSRKFNTAKVFDDRKAKAKRGYTKHKNSLPDESYRGRNATQGGVAGKLEIGGYQFKYFANFGSVFSSYFKSGVLFKSPTFNLYSCTLR